MISFRYKDAHTVYVRNGMRELKLFQGPYRFVATETLGFDLYCTIMVSHIQGNALHTYSYSIMYN